MLRVCLLTRGSPSAVTGGHLYQRRMAEAAGRHDATVEFAQASLWTRLPADADVVAVDSIAAWRLAGAVLRRRHRPPLVAVVHQRPGGVGSGPIRRWVQGGLDRSVYRRCAAVIVAGRAVADELVTVHGLHPSRVCLVEPGCDLPPGQHGMDLRQGRRIALVCVANWYPHKGVLELLDAVAALPAGHVTVHLVGRDDVDPRYTTRVRARLGASDLAGRVMVHGTLDQQAVADLYAGADVFALTSQHETYGTVVAEAVAAGLPVVAWREPHAERLITDGVNGLLVAPGDQRALTEALRSVATDDRLRSALATAASPAGRHAARWADSATAFFRVLRSSATAAVEPPDDGSARLDVDAAHAGVLDEQPPGDAVGDAEGPGERRLDRADVGDHHHGGRPGHG